MTDETFEHQDEYEEELLNFLQIVWGEGFLSPGGPEAVARVMEGLDVKDKLVLDIGCGLGGPDVILAEEYGARVIGLDIEEALVRRTRARIEAKGLAGRVEARLYKPGPLPVPDESIDVIFGKDSWIHIQDKDFFFADAYRALKPGGLLTAGDWMRSPDPYSEDMHYFFEIEGLTYHMDTQKNYARLLANAGFTDVAVEDISGQLLPQAKAEHAAMNGRLKQPMIDALGEERWAHFVENWRIYNVVLEKGELRPGRFRARKPE